jgi:8-oxo-dGTP pyrophosphatase MutT (NUDIX family)
MPREPIPTWYFVLVVVRLNNQFLLVQESRHGQFWYLPAGKVELGETLVEAAQRETLEEAGIPVIIEGVVRIEHTPQVINGARLRVIFIARPADNTPPKNIPDKESLQAGWYSLEEIERLPLRGDEVASIFKYVAGGGTIYPLELFAQQGTPYHVSAL